MQQLRRQDKIKGSRLKRRCHPVGPDNRDLRTILCLMCRLFGGYRIGFEGDNCRLDALVPRPLDDHLGNISASRADIEQRKPFHPILTYQSLKALDDASVAAEIAIDDA